MNNRTTTTIARIILAEKLFSAYFVEGRDVGDRQVLTDIGVEVGLRPKDIAEALSGGSVAAAAVAREEERARRAGTDSVPTFMVRGEVLCSGAQPEHLLAAAFEQAIAETALADPSDAAGKR